MIERPLASWDASKSIVVSTTSGTEELRRFISAVRTSCDAIDSQFRFLTRECAPLKVAKGLAVLSRKRLAADRRTQGRPRA
jgi:hypothetical protein